VYIIAKEGEAWMPSQPELRQDAESMAVPYLLYKLTVHIKKYLGVKCVLCYSMLAKKL
jgi:hypothetical protein